MMTREEASMHLFDDWYIENGRLCVDESNRDDFCKALGVGIKALRPVSREQVWRGWWLHDPETGYEHCDKCSHTISLDDYLNGKPPLFCEMCGAPMTDEAVQMVMERMEALHEIPPTT